MCYIVFTNTNKKWETVQSMTAGEVQGAEKCRDYMVIHVNDGITAAHHRLAIHIKIHQLLLRYVKYIIATPSTVESSVPSTMLLHRYMSPKTGPDLVFPAKDGDLGAGGELSRLAEHFGKKFIMPATSEPTPCSTEAESPPASEESDVAKAKKRPSAM